MQSRHPSMLLPDVFRYKLNHVRIFQPQIILLDFHGTISERKWEDKVIFPYVKKALRGYLKANLNHDAVQRCIPGLRNESFEQRFRNRYDDAPVIDDNDADVGLLADQLSDFLLWQITNKRPTKETQIVERLVWLDGYKQRRISTPVYEDVMQMVKKWSQSYACSIYVISSTDAETLKHLLKLTDRGDLSQFIAGYINPSETGNKMVAETYSKLYHLARPKSKTGSESKADQHVSNSKSTDAKCKLRSSSEAASSSPERQEMVKSACFEARSILFLTDSGQEAKAASRVADGRAYECLLVNRPENKKIRTYYLLEFQYVNRFDEIEFVKRESD